MNNSPFDNVDSSFLERLYKQKKQKADDDALAIKKYGVTLDEFLAQWENLADVVENKTLLIEQIIQLDMLTRLQKKIDPSLKTEVALTMMESFHHENLKRDLLKSDIRTLEVKVQNLIKVHFAEIKKWANHDNWVRGHEEDFKNAA